MQIISSFTKSQPTPCGHLSIKGIAPSVSSLSFLGHYTAQRFFEGLFFPALRSASGFAYERFPFRALATLKNMPSTNKSNPERMTQKRTFTSGTANLQKRANPWLLRLVVWRGRAKHSSLPDSMNQFSEYGDAHSTSFYFSLMCKDCFLRPCVKFYNSVVKSYFCITCKL